MKNPGLSGASDGVGLLPSSVTGQHTGLCVIVGVGGPSEDLLL